MDKDFQDRIDEYLLRGNKMSEEDKAQFLKEIEEDAEKKAQYEFTKNVKEAFVSRGDKLKAMAEFQKEYETRDDMRIKACSCSEYTVAIDRRIVEHKSNFRKKLVWFSSIAAVLVVGFFAINSLFVYETPNDNVRGDDNVFKIMEPNDSVKSDTVAVDKIIDNQ